MATRGLVATRDGRVVYRALAPRPAPVLAPVCFIAGGNMTNAGSRLRAYWPAQYIEGAAVCTWVDKPPPAAAYVFQKLVDLPLMKRLKAGGAACFWDVCDPVWWFNPDDARAVLEQVDAVVCSSTGLAADLRRWTDGDVVCHVIPDRVLLSHFDAQAQHTERTPVRLIWFGAAQNRSALYAAHANVARLQANGHAVELTICDNRPDVPMLDIEGACPVYYTRWALETEAATLAAHDVALLPPYPGPWGQVKSANKTLTAAACGLPVSDGQDYADLRALVTDVALRRARGLAGRRDVEARWQSQQSAAEWSGLLA